MRKKEISPAPSMKYLFTIGILFLLLGFCFSPTAIAQITNNKPLFPKGTFIVFTHTNKGLVICADKRVSYKGSDIPPNDNVKKLLPLKPNLGFAVAGVPFIPSKDGKTRYFDAVKIVVDYFDNNDFKDTEAFWDGLSKKIADSFWNYLDKTPYEEWPPTLFPGANYYFTQILFFFPGKNETQIGFIPVQYVKEKRQANINKFNVQLKGLYDCTGFTDVNKELKHGSDKRFDDLRSDPDIKTFLFDLKDVSKIEPKEAVTFSKKLIRATNERGGLLGAKENDIGVGLTCDCAIIDSKTGFKWLHQNSSVIEQPKKTVKKPATKRTNRGTK